MDHLPLVTQESLLNDLILQIQGQLAFLQQVLEKGSDVVGVHLAGMVGEGRSDIERCQNADSVSLDRFSWLGQLTVATPFGRQIDNNRRSGSEGLVA